MTTSLGLQFRKLDLHTHTPASKCYKFPEHTAEEIVQSAIDKGLDAIAITDHNSAAWIDKMKNAALGKPLVIFPGVEISVHEGYHVIVLFDPSETQEQVGLFLGALDFKKEQIGNSAEQTKKSIYDIMELAHNSGRNALVILAHIDDYKGAYKELIEEKSNGKVSIPKNCRDLFNSSEYDAVEVTHGDWPEHLNKANGITRFPAFYQSSDNPDPEQNEKHSKEGLGKRSTWFKLDEITVEGLRQCFTDPETRIRQMDKWKDSSWPHIVKMKVGSAGYLCDQNFQFHPGLNSIIGGKGAGKSLVIEFLRFALGQASEQNDILKDYQGKLEKRLTPMNHVEVEIVAASGERYLIKRTYEGKDIASFTCINLSTNENYDGNLVELFPILPYSQTEVIKIAEDEDAQLRLVDSLIDVRAIQRRIDDLQDRLTANNRGIADALAAKSKMAKAQEDVATFTESIKTIDAKLNSPLLKQMRHAEAKQTGLTEQQAFLDKLTVSLQQLSDEVIKKDVPQPKAEVTTDDLLKDRSVRLTKTKKDILNAFSTTQVQIDSLLADFKDETLIWKKEFDAIRSAYEMELAGSDFAQMEIDRRKNIAAMEEAEQQLQAYRLIVNQELPQLLDDRKLWLDQLEEQHSLYFDARKHKFEQLTTLSEGRLKLTLEHANNRTAYAKAVSEAWKGSGPGSITTAQREKISSNISPRQLVDYIINQDVSGLSTAAGFSQEISERVIAKAWDADYFADILALQHLYYLADTPYIQFAKSKNNYAPLNELSVGQKCTALLIIALCDGTRPIIIDQPEDALDIASVWNDIAVKLRRGKDGRQFILTTHNSTIAVGADSDYFMVLEAVNGQRAKIVEKGAIDQEKVRREVVEHMEGGDKPYLLRRDKLNIK